MKLKYTGNFEQDRLQTMKSHGIVPNEGETFEETHQRFVALRIPTASGFHVFAGLKLRHRRTGKEVTVLGTARGGMWRLSSTGEQPTVEPRVSRRKQAPVSRPSVKVTVQQIEQTFVAA